MKEYINLIELNKNSKILYETLLRFGPQNMSDLSKNSKLNRSSCYSFIKPLVSNGLVTKCHVDSKLIFVAEDPVKILERIKEQKDKYDFKYTFAKNLYKKYKKEFQRKRLFNRPKVSFFDGERGLQEAYEDTLKSSEDIRAYANIEEMHKGLPHFFPEYYKRRSDAHIFIHTISPNNEGSIERSKLDKKEFREIRFIDKEKYEFTPEINIYDNKILFASWKEKMAVVIESEEIADFHKKVFDVLYSKLKKNK